MAAAIDAPAPTAISHDVAGPAGSSTRAGASSSGSCRRMQPLELLRGATGLEAELLAQPQRDRSIRLECISLTARPVEGEHQLPDQMFVEG